MILLDTHVFVWTIASSAKLGQKARRLIDQAAQRRELAISTISYWEIATLTEARRLRLRAEMAQIRALALQSGLQEIPVDFEIATTAGRLSGLHGDPADRLVYATALLRKATLLTADSALLCLNGGPRVVDASR